MPNDLVPSGPQSPLELFTEKLNLPQMIAGPAGKAISRLVAGVVDIPAAYLDAFAQSIKDKTAARTAVNKEVADAAARLAAGDTDIVARAAHNLLAKEYRKQKNKEEISRRAVEILQEETKSLPPPQPDAPPSPEVDADWLNVFERYAEDASTERMQSVWAKILAGEIRKPTTFSLATLRFIAEVDEQTAALFRKYAGAVLNSDFIPYPENEGLPFTEMLALQNAGLLTGVGGTLVKILKAGPGRLFFGSRTRAILLSLTKEVEMRPTAILLTRIGKELYKITECDEDRKSAEQFAKNIPKDGVAQILYRPLADPSAVEILWEPEPQKPPDQPQPTS